MFPDQYLDEWHKEFSYLRFYVKNGKSLPLRSATIHFHSTADLNIQRQQVFLQNKKEEYF